MKTIQEIAREAEELGLFTFHAIKLKDGGGLAAIGSFNTFRRRQVGQSFDVRGFVSVPVWEQIDWPERFNLEDLCDELGITLYVAEESYEDDDYYEEEDDA